MFKSYLKIAWRNLARNKAYAFINVVGLSLGIGCSILIFTFIAFHLSYDNFHPQKDRIYRLVTHWIGEEEGHSAGVPTPLGKAFRTDYGFAELTARKVLYGDALIALPREKEVKKFEEEAGVAFTENAYFNIFNFPFLQGNKATALQSPNSAVITARLAKKYFGTANAIGKVIRFNNKIDFSVTGILKDKPANTDEKQEIYLSYDNLKDRNTYLADDGSWGGVYSGSYCFTLLKPNVNPNNVDKALVGLVKKYYSADDAKTWRFHLQPLSDVHFNPDYSGDADKKYLWALAFIGLFLIITACVNFINLATAQALNRSREVGIRKVLGSMRVQLFWQFLAETCMITVFAVFLGCCIAKLALPTFNQLFNTTDMTIDYFTNIQLILFLLVITLLVTFLSGSYPGLVMAKFQPVLALKSKLSQKHIGGFSLRRVLVVTQFAISQMLTISTIVIASQMSYSTKADLGFNKEATVMLPIPNGDSASMYNLRTRLQGMTGVEKVSLCFQAPAASSNNNTNIRYGNRDKDELFSVNEKFADADYLSLFNIKLLAGRNFFPSDTTREFVVNETLVKRLGFHSAQGIIGKMISLNGQAKHPVVGVVKDFNNYSMHDPLGPIAIFSDRVNYSNCAVKINMANIKPLLAQFEKTWNELYPDYVYKYQFLDERIARFYEADKVMLTLIEVFACIAIFIGCLGLYGLVSFMAIRKTKEIGVRKVLGASVTSIIWMFGKEFARLLVVAFFIAAPAAWWAMHDYLSSFTYRIEIGVTVFLSAILFTFVIAALTVGYRSVRAALANPVNNLRTE
jgi:putative ABC transport system permease protein